MKSSTKTVVFTENPLHQMFLHELCDIYDAEKQLIGAFSVWASSAQSKELRHIFKSLLDESKGHVRQLEQIFSGLGEKIKSKTNQAMKSLLNSGFKFIEDNEHAEALDASLIATAQRAEHCGIAAYGSLCAWANEMHYEHELEILHSILGEEKIADEKLTAIAVDYANPYAFGTETD